MEMQQKETLERAAENYPLLFAEHMKEWLLCAAAVVLLTEREERRTDTKMDLSNVLEKMAATGMFHCENVWGV